MFLHRAEPHHVWHVVLLVSIFIGISMGFIQGSSVQVGASSWLNDEIMLLEYEDFNGDINDVIATDHECTYETIMTAKIGWDTEGFEGIRACVSYGESFRMAYSSDKGKVYVSANPDDVFYATDIVVGFRLYHLVGTDSVIIGSGPMRGPVSLYSFDNLLQNLHLTENKFYFFDWNNDVKLTGGHILESLHSWGISSNGRYLVYGKYTGISSGYGITRINLFILDNETGQHRMFGVHTLHQGIDLPELAVSKDGRSVVATEKDMLRFWHIKPGCTVDADHHVQINEAICPTVIHYPYYHEKMPGNGWNLKLLVNDDFTEISYIYYAPNSKFVKLGIAGTDLERLDYLALGDSYSSGEGDVVKGKSNPYLFESYGSGFCHLSVNSYPYALTDLWSVERSSMHSVACSGAKVKDDYISETQYYMGQNNSLLEKTIEQREARRKEALDKFIPGVVPQLEFIKKYKPKVITLTGGGNDVGFASVLKTCASPEVNMLGAITAGTCAYVEPTKLRKMLTDSIRNQYKVTRDLLSEIKWVSPESKVYLIGYPKFVAEGAAACMFNSGDLNSKERAMVNSMQEELNNVLWRAAEDAGVKFIDIEDSLEGGKLCQGSEYMTGLVDIGVGKIRRGDIQEAFHPNANGHKRMANAIYNEVPSVSHAVNLKIRSNVKSGQEYESSQIALMLNMLNESVGRLSMHRIKIDPLTLQPGSIARLAFYSDPTPLGTFTVNLDGGIDAEVTLPKDLTMGYHTLVLEGIAALNEPITLYQHVTVTSDIEGDMDGDGILDESDKCLFITRWVDETTGKDVCNGSSADDSSSDASSANSGTILPGGPNFSQNHAKVANVLYSQHNPVKENNMNSNDNSMHISGNNATLPNLNPHKPGSNMTDRKDASNFQAQFILIALPFIFLIVALYAIIRKRNARKTK